MRMGFPQEEAASSGGIDIRKTKQNPKKMKEEKGKEFPGTPDVFKLFKSLWRGLRPHYSEQA